MSSYEETLAKIYEERLSNFYKKYDESKLEHVGALLNKYKGKEEQLLRAMVQKYGPEPTPEELAEEDEDEDATVDDDAPDHAGSKDVDKIEKKEAIDEDDDQVSEEESTELIYCGVCGLPPEYCEYGNDYEKCIPWLKEHCPHLLKNTEVTVDAKKKKRGGGVIKKKELSEDKMRVIVYTETRSRKKIVTVVEGLETLGVKLKDASKLFGRKFACSSSVKDKDSGGTEIVIQGDVIYDLPDLLKSEYKISQAKLFTKEAGGKIAPLR